MKLRSSWRRLSDRDRRAIRLGALILAPVLTWFVGISPYLDAVQDRRSRLEARRSLLQAERDLLAGRDRYPRQVTLAATRLRASAPLLLDGRSRGVATAELTQYVEDRAASSRLRLTTTEPRGFRRVDSRLLAVPLTVEGESDLEGVLTFLDALANGPKLLRIGDLRLRRRREIGERGEQMEVLVMGASVTGYMLYAEGRSGEGTEDTGKVASEAPAFPTVPSMADRGGPTP